MDSPGYAGSEQMCWFANREVLLILINAEMSISSKERAIIQALLPGPFGYFRPGPGLTVTHTRSSRRRQCIMQLPSRSFRELRDVSEHLVQRFIIGWFAVVTQ